MKGLICRDLLICYRRTSKINYITDAIFFLFFLLVRLCQVNVGNFLIVFLE